jgi:glycosyltransferase involved in cell wall biosynthesis
VKHYAVIPTHNRPDDLAALLDTIPDSIEVLVIDNASEPPVMLNQDIVGLNVQVHRDEEQPPNLSRLWNIGLDWAHTRSNHDPGWRNPTLEPRPEYAVAILNDDVVLPPGLLEILACELDNHQSDIAFPHVSHGQGKCFVNDSDPFPGVGRRLTGWCFVVRGTSGLRADESLRWWCGDDDLQAQAVRNGRGTVGVDLPAHRVAGLMHKHPDESTTGALREQADKDMATFVKKWGQRPW